MNISKQITREKAVTYPCILYIILGGEYLLSTTYQKFNEKVLKNKVKLVNGYGST